MTLNRPGSLGIDGMIRHLSDKIAMVWVWLLHAY